MISISPPSPRPASSYDGLELTETRWRLDPEEYSEFVKTVTGVTVTGNLSASDCYRIGNRLEGFIEERMRRDEWRAALVEEHPDVESLEEIRCLARFFRRCHDCRRHDPEAE